MKVYSAKIRHKIKDANNPEWFINLIDSKLILLEEH